jgi:Protein of unknown function (DUF3489)
MPLSFASLLGGSMTLIGTSPKQELVIAMLRQPEGATVDEVVSVIGWQRHTVRGVF